MTGRITHFNESFDIGEESSARKDIRAELDCAAE